VVETVPYVRAPLRLADEIGQAWELCFQSSKKDYETTRFRRLRLGQIQAQLWRHAHVPASLPSNLRHPKPERLRRGSRLAALVRDHAREREALGFAPRDIVTEFLVLRRVLWRLIRHRSATLDAGDVFVLEERLHDVIDSLVTECVVAYFDRATSELSHRARHDALTDLLNHSSFTRELELELERAKRYGTGVTLVYFDFDGFKDINDTTGIWPAIRLCGASRGLRLSFANQIPGRMGGDEFAAFRRVRGDRSGLLDRAPAIDELGDSGEGRVGVRCDQRR
jgi:hypothetical protein